MTDLQLTKLLLYCFLWLEPLDQTVIGAKTLTQLENARPKLGEFGTVPMYY